ncbi:substrate-binding domain-containing protein [Streptomyces sp. NPDC005811]|uniref:substrate-binding domain-containing protein n=1 Tax=Streptomyces sp. NPDC005811 TaxID=3154565 RepID=UPI0033FE18E6
MRRHHRAAALTATALAGALFAAGCSSGSGGKKAEKSANGAAAGKADTPRMTVAMVTHASPGDTFWDLIRKGARAAAAKPEAMKDVVAKATAAGIPVVGFNSGVDDWKALGMLEYFGQDENIAGQAFGKRLDQLGAKHALCVIQEQGQVALEARCAGLKKGFSGTTDILYVNGTDMPSVKSTITAKLKQDSSIDQVVTLGAPIALTAVQSLSDAGTKAEVATFDLNESLVKAAQDGTVEFAVDQQPYLQGYLAVDALWLYKNNGNVSGGGTAPVLTGPAFITKDNVDAVAKFAANGTR